LAVKYASQLQGRSLTSKLKKVFETNQNNTFLESANFAGSSFLDKNAGLNFVKYDSTKLNGV
jgi:hypothetical protein